MTGEEPAKKRRRRKRRRPSVPSVQPGVNAGPVQREAVVSEAYDEEKHDREIKETLAHHERIHKTTDELVSEVLPLIMQERHKAVFDYLCAIRGVTPAGLITQIIRQEIARETPNYREYLGGGGSSSKDGAVLAERLPAKR